jgi:hypothetical protein
MNDALKIFLAQVESEIEKLGFLGAGVGYTPPQALTSLDFRVLQWILPICVQLLLLLLLLLFWRKGIKIKGLMWRGGQCLSSL